MLVSLIGFGALLALIFLRVPVAFAMAAVGLVGFAAIRSWDATWSMVGQIAFDQGRSYTLSVIPLFIFMGNVITLSGISADLFRATNAVFGRFRGGLAVASVVACGGFSAVCGSSLATAATMSKVAMPSMRRYGYADSLAAGSIAAGGTLGILIPPSVILIIYGITTESDIAQLFIAGVLPGLLGVLLYCLAVTVVTWFRPGLGPRGERFGFAETLRALSGVWGMVVLFAAIMGGIYGGFFTPTEAAGVGAGLSVLLALVRRQLSARGLYQAVLESVRTTAMIFAIIIGAEIFSNFVNFAGLPDELAWWVGDLQVHPFWVIGAIMLIYIALGCILESLSMVLLTVPIFFPILYQLDFGNSWLADPEMAVIWFGILVVVVTEISLITPPVGLNVFVLRSVLKDVSLGTLFRGVIPFWMADLVRLAILLAFPAVSLWLVRAMG